MFIAVFADLHGHIPLALRLCARWQRETGQRLDAILQAGDLGAFPSVDRLDRPTMRYATRDPDELGFLTYFQSETLEPAISEPLAELSCKLIFARGNHEDHEWLDRLERSSDDRAVFPVDPHGYVLCLKTGVPLVLTAGDHSLTILGIGRIGPVGDSPNPRQPPLTYLQPHEQERVESLCREPRNSRKSIDVLLTHDLPRHDQGGLRVIREALDRLRPAYHFHGHVGGPVDQHPDDNRTTKVCKLADLTWSGNRGIVQPGSMAILAWSDRDQHSLQVVNAPWFYQYSAASWSGL